MIDLLICTELLVDRRANDPIVPKNKSILLPSSLHKTILFESILDKTDYSISESVFVAIIAQLNVKMASTPVLEDKVPDVNFINDVSISNVHQFVVLAHLFLGIFLHLFLLTEVLLFRLILFVHLL